MHQPDALRCLEPLERRDVGAAATCKCVGSLRGGALGVECGLDGWSAPLDGAIRLLLDESPDAHGEAPRRRETLDCTVLQPGIVQALLDAVRERFREREQRLGRQLLGADLDQEIAPGCHHATSVGSSVPDTADLEAGAELPSIGKPSASRLAKYASATPRASVRTRRM